MSLVKMQPLFNSELNALELKLGVSDMDLDEIIQKVASLHKLRYSSYPKGFRIYLDTVQRDFRQTKKKLKSSVSYYKSHIPLPSSTIARKILFSKKTIFIVVGSLGLVQYIALNIISKLYPQKSITSIATAITAAAIVFIGINIKKDLKRELNKKDVSIAIWQDNISKLIEMQNKIHAILEKIDSINSREKQL